MDLTGHEIIHANENTPRDSKAYKHALTLAQRICAIADLRRISPNKALGRPLCIAVCGHVVTNLKVADLTQILGPIGHTKHRSLLERAYVDTWCGDVAFPHIECAATHRALRIAHRWCLSLTKTNATYILEDLQGLTSEDLPEETVASFSFVRLLTANNAITTSYFAFPSHQLKPWQRHVFLQFIDLAQNRTSELETHDRIDLLAMAMEILRPHTADRDL